MAEQNVEQENLEETLADIDAILAEEDPEFLEQLSQIKIDNVNVDLSLMDQVALIQSGQFKPQSAFFQDFKKMFQFRENPKQVILFWLTITLTIGCVYYLTKMVPWETPDTLFLRSYADMGVTVENYNPSTETEPFFDNAKLTKNLVTIKKLVANIKPSETSSGNPMLAFEINIEGMTNEVVVEVKDREAEFKDIILRTTEEFNYDELVNPQGKQMLADKIMQNINAQLTKGQVRKVFYKSFVLKI